MPRDIKVMVIGDTAVGKTCLLISYTSNSFPTGHIPTVFDNYSANALVGGEAIKLGLWDTAGSQEFKDLRPLSYPGTDVFIICFSLTDPDSLAAVTDMWYPEIVECGLQETPIVLVGTKLDLRNSGQADNCVTKKQGEAKLREIEGTAYIECSSLTQENVSEVFEMCIRCVLMPETIGEEPKSGSPTQENTAGKGGKDKNDRCLIQ
eukprot:TRINITY_DN13575_c0_g1_i1.p1 TRINITY_DN13575_c0_g1~~TRINITY_DN13575_c0_g1_i1.p1  ORF type:complete len:218 (-),score=52.14 TRINITY_DN13575_c0_g1_i1:224-841(-)